MTKGKAKIISKKKYSSNKGLNSSTINERGRWCLKVGGAGPSKARKEVTMATRKRPPPTKRHRHTEGLSGILTDHTAGTNPRAGGMGEKCNWRA